jgi:tRNA threonylcarbamoyl adenosine modification protein YeaZ
VQLAIESSSDEPGVALARDGAVTHVHTWRTRQNHSVELLPAVERLLEDARTAKADLSAVFVDIGPGGYAALRVGVSIAKALAHALAIPLAGIGRLELDAWLVREDARGRRIVAAHRAGRGEYAWAVYGDTLDGWREETPPHITPASGLANGITRDVIVTGDLDDEIREMASGAGALALPPREHRVVALSTLGNTRLGAGRADDPPALVPLYLRAPAIGRQDG